jgi:protocatechuate 3,4-dioxygenase alpha subunit
MSLRATASQTIGPFFRIAMAWCYRAELGSAESSQRVAVQGRVFDGGGAALADALLELWQADEHGRYDHAEDPQRGDIAPGFRGFGRVQTDHEGVFRFSTVKPGRVPWASGTQQASHINVQLFTRGLLKPVHTRLYFPDPANDSDPVLQLVPPARRATLIATHIGAAELRWDVHLQGENETVFFAF